MSIDTILKNSDRFKEQGQIVLKVNWHVAITRATDYSAKNLSFQEIEQMTLFDLTALPQNVAGRRMLCESDICWIFEFFLQNK